VRMCSVKRQMAGSRWSDGDSGQLPDNFYEFAFLLGKSARTSVRLLGRFSMNFGFLVRMTKVAIESMKMGLRTTCPACPDNLSGQRTGQPPPFRGGVRLSGDLSETEKKGND
jgi:hypothetical protein